MHVGAVVDGCLPFIITQRRHFRKRTKPATPKAELRACLAVMASADGKTLLFFLPLFLKRHEDLLRRKRQVVEADAQGVVDGVGYRRRGLNHQLF
jgi:DNA repair photolyase